MLAESDDKVESACELDPETRDCYCLLLIMRCEYLHRVDAAGRKIAAENKRDAG